MLNENFLLLQKNYLFQEIDKKASEHLSANPQLDLLNLGKGDSAFPLCSAIAEALCVAAKEMSQKTIGYGPTQGYPFLREAICHFEYAHTSITVDEIFVSDGAKNDTANILELFFQDAKIGICDPIYPVYLDSAVISGKAKKFNERSKKFENIHDLPCLEKNNFMPSLPTSKVQLIYLCSPNNPTGVAYTKEELTKWVNYAKENQAVIIFDRAYKNFITEKHIPQSIYEIAGAKQVAIEISSFSKTAGFSGLRCSYIVIPNELTILFDNETYSLNQLWQRRISSKFGGVAYPIQKAAQAAFSYRGREQLQEIISIYQNNVSVLLNGLKKLGFTVYGGVNSPYVWWKIPEGYKSWEFFEFLLKNLQIISVPGVGFGKHGENFIRLSAFAQKKTIEKALDKLSHLEPLHD